MAKNKVACAFLATALATGTLASAPMAWAESNTCTAELEAEACVASDIEQLELGLANNNIITISTSGIISISGGSVDKTLEINKIINGKAGVNLFEIKDGAKLTLTGNGTINSGRYGAEVNGAELVIDGVTIDATTDKSYGVYALNNGRVTIKSGQVIADYAAFAGNNTTGDMNFYVEGGLLKSNRYPAIYMPGQVDLIVRGGTLDGGIVARMGQIVIESGIINTQDTPLEGDGIDQNYSGMPSVADEAITLIAGSYKSANVDHGNDMNVVITGEDTQVNGDVVLYDLGNTASGYDQNINIEIKGGHLTGFKTKFTEEEIGFKLKSGYTAGLNNAADRIDIEISGGNYSALPDWDYLAAGYTAYNNGTEVAPYEVLVEGVISLPDSIYLQVGDTYDLKKNINTTAFDFGNFELGNLLDYATVSDNYNMKAVAPGTAVIRYSLRDAYEELHGGVGGMTYVYVLAPSEEDLSEDVDGIIDAIIGGDEAGNFTYAEFVTATDIAAAEAAGATYDAAITSENIDKGSISGSVADAIDDEVEGSLPEGTEVAGYYDIDVQLLAVTGGNTQLLGYINKLSSPATVTVTLPASVSAVADGYTRTYYMVRYHDGTTKVIDAVDNGDGTISFDSDSFSTYALAYVDKADKKEDTKIEENIEENTEEKSESESGDANSPETGAMTAESGSAVAVIDIVPVAMMSVIVLIVGFIVASRKKVQK